MSQLSLNPGGTSLATTPDGRQLRVGDCDCDCGATPSDCPRWLRFALCTDPQSLCWPDAPIPTEIFVCATQQVVDAPPAPDGHIPTVGEIVDQYLVPVANDSFLTTGGIILNPCYSFADEAPGDHRGSFVPVYMPRSCRPLEGDGDEAPCGPDLCESYVPLSPCGGLDAGCAVYLRAAAARPSGAVAINCGTLASPNLVCFCVTGSGAPVRTNQIPAGARVLADIPATNSCCECLAGLSQCFESHSEFQWIADDQPLQPVTCCCGGAVVSIEGGGTYTVVQVGSGGGQGPFTSITTIDGFALYNGSWWAVGTATTTDDTTGQTTSSLTIGPPNGNYDLSFNIPTDCGAYLRHSLRDIAWPIDFQRNDGLLGSFSIAGGCNGRTEAAFGDNSGLGSSILVTVTLQYAITIHREGACDDDCRGGGGAGQPIMADVPRGTSAPCKGCGKSGPTLEAFR